MADDRMELARELKVFAYGELDRAKAIGSSVSPGQKKRYQSIIKICDALLSVPAAPSEGLVDITRRFRKWWLEEGQLIDATTEPGFDPPWVDERQLIAKRAFIAALSTPATSRPEKESGYYEPLYPAASPLPVVPEEVMKIAEDLLDRVSRATPGPWEANTPPIKGYCEIHGGIDGDANDDGTLRSISTHVCDVIDNEDEQGNLEWIEAANPYAVEKLLSFIVGLGTNPKA